MIGAVKERVEFPQAIVVDGEAFLVDISIDPDCSFLLRAGVKDAFGKFLGTLLIDTAFLSKGGYTGIDPIMLQLSRLVRRRVVQEGKTNGSQETEQAGDPQGSL